MSNNTSAPGADVNGNCSCKCCPVADDANCEPVDVGIIYVDFPTCSAFTACRQQFTQQCSQANMRIQWQQSDQDLSGSTGGSGTSGGSNPTTTAGTPSGSNPGSNSNQSGGASSSSGGSNVGLIVGLVVGAVVLAAIALAVFKCMQSRKKKKDQNMEFSFKPQTFSRPQRPEVVPTAAPPPFENMKPSPGSAGGNAHGNLSPPVPPTTTETSNAYKPLDDNVNTTTASAAAIGYQQQQMQGGYGAPQMYAGQYYYQQPQYVDQYGQPVMYAPQQYVDQSQYYSPRGDQK